MNQMARLSLLDVLIMLALLALLLWAARQDFGRFVGSASPPPPTPAVGAAP